MVEEIIKAVASKLDWILENYSSDESEYLIYCKVSGSEKWIKMCRTSYSSDCAIFPDDWDNEINYNSNYLYELKYLTIDQAQTILESDTFEIRYPED